MSSGANNVSFSSVVNYSITSFSTGFPVMERNFTDCEMQNVLSMSSTQLNDASTNRSPEWKWKSLSESSRLWLSTASEERELT